MIHIQLKEKDVLNVGIMGATGYAGEELIDILLRHAQVEITHVSAKIDKPQAISEIFPRFKNRLDLICAEPDIKEIIQQCELVFLALPHTVSMEFVPQLLAAGKKVIDLSADYRLKDTRVYEKFYQTQHKDKAHLKEAVYGLTELYRENIKEAKLVANPGCYPTVAILGLAPVVAMGGVDLDSIIIDAKSGYTGAGRKFPEDAFLSEINGDFKAYKVGVHQHTPEIDQELSKLADKKVKVTFVPHLLPLARGILETIYIKKSKKVKVPATKHGGSTKNFDGKIQNLINLYKKFYKKEPFIRILEKGNFPRIKEVVHTNFCDIGIKEDSHQIIIVAAIDNLLKGASGQAVQNMNMMYDFAETAALV